MGVKHLFLTLLSKKNMHGYELKNTFEGMVSDQWPLNFGQVYTTLTRLERDGLVAWEGIQQEEKPDKKVYRITEEGKKALDEWLNSSPEWNVFSDEISFKLAAFEVIGSEKASAILLEYRQFLLQLIHELIQVKEEKMGDNPYQQLIIERNILKAEADLKWLDICSMKMEGQK